MSRDRWSERLNRVAKPLNTKFYADCRRPCIYTAHWTVAISFRDDEIAKEFDDKTLEQLVIDRITAILQDQINYLKSLR